MSLQRSNTKGASHFLKQGVDEVVLIGSVRRPSLREIIPDWYTFKFLCSIWSQKLGDDALLRRIIQLFEKEGMKVIGIQDVIPNLQVPEGVLGKINPTKLEKSDVDYGFEIAKKLGQVDVGQGVIVQQGLVLSLEGIEGTDALIKRTKQLKRKGGSGVLVKVSKPQQDLRVDMPTIGMNTVRLIHESGLKGIAVEADSVLLVDIEKTIELADKLGVFILGLKAK